MTELTGQRYTRMLFSAFPGHLKELAARVPSNHPWRDVGLLIRDHTTLPYFTYFDPPERRSRAFSLLADTEIGQRVEVALGLTTYRCDASPRHPRWCAECVAEDEAEHGFAYFHREHQLPGVAYCWKHGCVLLEGCRRCGPYPIRGMALAMPGRCKCGDGIVPASAFAGLPEDRSPLLWLASESAYMVGSQGPLPSDPIQSLRSALIAQGLSRGSLITPKVLARAVEETYGTPTLDWLHYPVWTTGRPSAWLRRMFRPDSQRARRIPTLAVLLVAGAIFTSMTEFESWEDQRTEIGPSAPDGGAGGKSHQPETKVEGTKTSWKANLKELLQQHAFRIPATAMAIGVHPWKVAGEAFRQSIRVPLPGQVSARLGAAELAAIRSELSAGVPKKTIREAHQITEWTLRLIELDGPGFRSTHSSAAMASRRECHRRRFLDLIRRHPGISRAAIQTQLPGTYDFLTRRDRDWYCANAPAERPRGSSTRPRPRIDWTEVDRKLAPRIVSLAAHLRASPDKPTWATKGRLLKGLGAAGKYEAHAKSLPDASRVLAALAESREAFFERRIRWGMIRMAAAGMPISMNKLRRVVALSAPELRKHKEFVAKTADELGAPVDPRSIFS